MFSYRHSPSKAALNASGPGGGEAMEWLGGVLFTSANMWKDEQQKNQKKEMSLESKQPVMSDLPFKPQM